MLKGFRVSLQKNIYIFIYFCQIKNGKRVIQIKTHINEVLDLYQLLLDFRFNAFSLLLILRGMGTLNVALLFFLKTNRIYFKTKNIQFVLRIAVKRVIEEFTIITLVRVISIRGCVILFDFFLSQIFSRSYFFLTLLQVERLSESLPEAFCILMINKFNKGDKCCMFPIISKHSCSYVAVYPLSCFLGISFLIWKKMFIFRQN